MAEFEGFGEVSLLYADNYHLVEAMKKKFDEQCSSLFAVLEDKVIKAAWFDAACMSISRGNYYLDIHMKGKDGGEVCVLHIYLGPRELSSTYYESGKGFIAQLMFPLNMKDTKPARDYFVEKAKVAFADRYNSEDIGKSKYLISVRRSFDLERFLEAILAELGNFIEVVPLVEEAISVRER